MHMYITAQFGVTRTTHSAVSDCSKQEDIDRGKYDQSKRRKEQHQDRPAPETAMGPKNPSRVHIDLPKCEACRHSKQCFVELEMEDGYRRRVRVPKQYVEAWRGPGINTREFVASCCPLCI